MKNLRLIIASILISITLNTTANTVSSIENKPTLSISNYSTTESEKNSQEAITHMWIGHKHILEITLNDFKNNLSCYIVDKNGSVVGSSLINKNKTQILLNNFPSGEYTVKIKSKELSVSRCITL